jgi:ribosomal-protein-alanine N-acetyltransferase
MDQLPVISTERISLRRIRDDDVDDFYAVYSDPQVMRYWSTPPLADKDAASKLISEIHEGLARRAILKWGIALRADDKLIGSVTLFNLDFTHRNVRGFCASAGKLAVNFRTRTSMVCFARTSRRS